MVVPIKIIPLEGVPLINEGDDLTCVILNALECSNLILGDGDIIVLAQKIVSKAEGRLVILDDIVPSQEALGVAQRVDKDPRLVQLILDESVEILRERSGALIVRHRLGLVLANAGIDQSNIEHARGEQALLLPLNPDATSQLIRAAIRDRTGADIAVLIVDSLGRAWRMGTVGVAIGVAGMPGLIDLRGAPDLHGRSLQSSELGWADEVAAAASLAMGQADEATPVILVRGVHRKGSNGVAAELIRPIAMDMFR